MEIQGVYEIVHKPTGLRYIGHSTNIPRRITQHTLLLKSKKHPNKYLQTLWDNSDSTDFIINTLYKSSNKKDQLRAEILHKYNPLNLSTTSSDNRKVQKSKIRQFLRKVK